MKKIIILAIFYSTIAFSASNNAGYYSNSILNELMNIINNITSEVIDDKLILDKTIPTEINKTLTLDISAGNVEVKTHNSNEAVIKIYGNENTFSVYDITAIETSAGVEVKAKPVNSENHQKNAALRVVITLPDNYNADLKTKGGSIKADGLNGFVKVNLMGGNIELKNITGDIEGKTHGGNIALNDTKGSVNVSTMGGNISVNDFDGNINVETKGGHIVLKGKNGKVYASTFGGNINFDYSGENYGIELLSKAGSITMNLPAGFNAAAEIKTTVGSIKSDFGEPVKSSMSSELVTSIGTGGSVVKAKTFAGNITVTKK